MSGTVAYRRPRLQILVNGVAIAGAESAEVSSNGYQQSDKFRATIAMGLDPTMTMAWWADNANVQVNVQFGFLPDGAPEGAVPWQSMIIGNVDHVTIDPIRGQIDIDGRDLSSLLIDAKTQEAFANQTSSQIATTLAGRHGLTPVVTATTTLVGQYYSTDHTTLTLDNFTRQSTEWDLLTYLAQQEGFDVWVQGNSLYFAPPPTAAAPVALTFQQGPPYSTFNAETLRMERSLTLAKDIQVTVRSWNSAAGKAITRIVKATGAKGSKNGALQNYVMKAPPDRTPDQLLKLATSYLEDLSKHERVVAVTMPGEMSITTRTMVSLSGTNSAWDQSYFVAEVERELSMSGGYRQRLRLKNTSPRTQSTVV